MFTGYRFFYITSFIVKLVQYLSNLSISEARKYIVDLNHNLQYYNKWITRVKTPWKYALQIKAFYCVVLSLLTMDIKPNTTWRGELLNRYIGHILDYCTIKSGTWWQNAEIYCRMWHNRVPRCGRNGKTSNLDSFTCRKIAFVFIVGKHIKYWTLLG